MLHVLNPLNVLQATSLRRCSKMSNWNYQLFIVSSIHSRFVISFKLDVQLQIPTSSVNDVVFKNKQTWDWDSVRAAWLPRVLCLCHNMCIYLDQWLMTYCSVWTIIHTWLVFPKDSTRCSDAHHSTSTKAHTTGQWWCV